MAARAPESAALQVLDLRHLQAQDLTALLEEENHIWSRDLHWDFHPSCDIVRRYVDMRALSGYALLDGSTPVGYTYYVHEDHKVLIGDLFISASYRTLETQRQLLEQVIETARHTPGVGRIEAQLMMFDPQAADSLFPPSELAVFERNFMLAGGIGALTQESFGKGPAAGVAFERWSERHTEPAAALIARCYQGHVDSRINDQYRSIAGARRFLHNIIQYPGCGVFHQPAAVIAIDAATREMCGISLTSLVEPTVGHITQICVAPERRSTGVGSELLWRSIHAFCERGCDAVSLTVTASNTGAVRLYERVGFRTIRQFCAYVWEGFR